MVCFYVLLLIFAAYLIVCWRMQVRFDREFPPISDDEFMARCQPGTNREIVLKVREIVSDCVNIDYDQVYPSTCFWVCDD